MAEHILQTTPPENGIIFRLRYDTNTRWMNSDVILKPGEMAIAAFPNTNAILPPKAVGIKVGDGTHYFDELPWIQAVAADVYSWAKSINKPSYTANEIVGLADYIAAHSSGSGGSAGSGNYQIVWDENSSKYILQQWDDTEEEWKDTSSNIDFSGILTRVDAIERWANGDRNNLGNIEFPIGALIYDEVITYLNKLDVNDTAVPHQFVTAVSEVDGKIQITRSTITASDITEGVLNTENGGTGLSRLESDELMVGSVDGRITTRTFVTEIDTANRNSFATVGAIIDYVTLMTAGLTGAMHFVGEATVNIPNTPANRVDPRINGYVFSNAQPGDVILANNAQEFVWTGERWRLLGDEGSYAIKGSITNADIATEANIDQSKIAGLQDTFDTKVDKQEGKTLSSNDYTDEDKEKLDNIEDNAQVNTIEHVFLNNDEIIPGTVQGVDKSINLQIPILSNEDLEKINRSQENTIEHIYVNNTEIYPATINNVQKVVNINFLPYTAEEQEKLAEIESGAEVNKIESIVINGTAYDPVDKTVEITIDQAALNLNVLEGALIPGTTAGTREEIDLVTGTKKLALARIAKTGNVKDLLQSTDEYITLYCGTSTDVV